jgi:predicted DNA-binding WGR domain protein
MTAISLTRIDASINMKRFYKIDIQPTLFGEWALLREWGRIGSSGQVRSTVYGSLDEAEAAHKLQYGAKLRRGYVEKVHLAI